MPLDLCTPTSLKLTELLVPLPRFLKMTENEIQTDSPFSLEAVANALGTQTQLYIHTQFVNAFLFTSMH